MTLRSRFLGLAVCFLLLAGPAAAQSQSDVAGAVPMSDVSGTRAQSDPMVFQSDEARIRLADVAAALGRALRTGTLPASVSGTGQPAAVPGGVADLFLAASRAERRAAARQVAETLTAGGLPAAEATALARATAGLLEDGGIRVERFLPALRAFNAVVDAAPAPALARPPAEFVVVRAVLTTLLDGTAS